MNHEIASLLTGEVNTKIYGAQLRIIEAGMVPKIRWPNDTSQPGATIKVVVDIEATLRRQGNAS